MSISDARVATIAFKERKRFSKYERKVKVDRNGMAIFYLFDYPIAAHTKDGRFFIKKPSIVDNSFVLRQMFVLILEMAGIRYHYWANTLDGHTWDGAWTEIFNAGTVTMINKQNPFKLYEH